MKEVQCCRVHSSVDKERGGSRLKGSKELKLLVLLIVVCMQFRPKAFREVLACQEVSRVDLAWNVHDLILVWYSTSRLSHHAWWWLTWRCCCSHCKLALYMCSLKGLLRTYSKVCIC